MSKVISFRVQDDLYNMLEYSYNAVKVGHERSCKEYGFVYNPMTGISLNDFAKNIFCNAVGREYFLVKNNESED